jgi:ABC-type sugar transport system ATPase subunit
MQRVLESLGKRYPGRGWALSEFTLTLEAGVTGLLGPNGAGKSTLMRILATVTRPSAGRVLWEGRDLSREPDALRETLGYLPQDFGIYPQLSAARRSCGRSTWRSRRSRTRWRPRCGCDSCDPERVGRHACARQARLL